MVGMMGVMGVMGVMRVMRVMGMMGVWVYEFFPCVVCHNIYHLKLLLQI
jgi:hypothetical protein